MEVTRGIQALQFLGAVLTWGAFLVYIGVMLVLLGGYWAVTGRRV